jgi:hypothetical protein
MTLDYDASDAAYDDYLRALHQWCADNGEDPDDPDAIDAFCDERALDADPYAYYGVSRGDFG